MACCEAVQSFLIMSFKTAGWHAAVLSLTGTKYVEAVTAMSDREPTRWQHNSIYPYPHPISPCVYTYDSRLYSCETVDAHCSNIIKL